MYVIVIYANIRGIKSIDRIVELYERDLTFISPEKEPKSKWNVFYEFGI